MVNHNGICIPPWRTKGEGQVWKRKGNDRSPMAWKSYKDWTQPGSLCEIYGRSYDRSALSVWQAQANSPQIVFFKNLKPWKTWMYFSDNWNLFVIKSPKVGKINFKNKCGDRRKFPYLMLKLILKLEQLRVWVKQNKWNRIRNYKTYIKIYVGS